MSTIETVDEVNLKEKELQIINMRLRISDLLANNTGRLLAIMGPCALTDEADLLDAENRAIKEFDAETGITCLHRIPPWKPRTNPADWHGEETTDPEGAFRSIKRKAERAANVCIELGLTDHTERYNSLLSFAWIGGRNSNNFDFQKHAALTDVGLPLGIKNGLDGEVDGVLDNIDRITRLRGSAAAPLVLIYRGGSNAQNPDDWEKQYVRAHELTDGRLIVDVAHGGEMAHDPNSKFKKSTEGQIACADHVIELARQGIVPTGIMIESSDAVSPTDPNMPFQTALERVSRLNNLLTGQTNN